MRPTAQVTASSSRYEPSARIKYNSHAGTTVDDNRNSHEHRKKKPKEACLYYAGTKHLATTQVRDEREGEKDVAEG